MVKDEYLIVFAPRISTEQQRQLRNALREKKLAWWNHEKDLFLIRDRRRRHSPTEWRDFFLETVPGPSYYVFGDRGNWASHAPRKASGWMKKNWWAAGD